MKFYLLMNSKLLINSVVFLLSLAECEFFMLMNMKMPTIVGIFIFIIHAISCELKSVRLGKILSEI